MKQVSYKDFAKDFYEKLKVRKPLHGQIELTYRCGFRCPYCYLKPYQTDSNYNGELSFKDWAKILDELYRERCMSLVFTGGDPLLRKDFQDIYLYAKKRGFIITVFTNAVSLTDGIIGLFKKHLPFSIEITLNSLTKDRFDIITGTKGKFNICIANVRKAVEMGLPIVLKTNGLRINKDEVIQIKEFAKDLLGEKRYKFDTYITPCLDGDKRPLKYRLSPSEIVTLEESDEEIKEAITESYKEDPVGTGSNGNLYRCNTWFSSFYINPYGRLQFCHLTDKYSIDLKSYSFKEGFYEVFPKLADAKFTRYTRCRECEYISECITCPARSYLECGDEETPAEYFCELAKTRIEQKKRLEGRFYFSKP